MNLEIIERSGNLVLWTLDGLDGDSNVEDGLVVDAGLCDSSAVSLQPNAGRYVMREVQAWLDDQPAKTRKFRYVRCAGGFLRHIAETTKGGKALCGHKPRGTTTMGQGRAKWYPASTDCCEDYYCKKCEAKLAKIEGPCDIS
jgi:hypothetical protein